MVKCICEALPNTNQTVRLYGIFILQPEAVSVTSDDRTDHVVEEGKVHDVVLNQE